MKPIRLVENTINEDDVNHLIEWLKTYPRLTKGEKTIEFEKAWSKWLGCKYSVFVNSGSSANLLMLYALIAANKLKIGDKVGVPAVSWATDLAPVIQLGLEPVLIDCSLNRLNIDVGSIRAKIQEHDIKALLLVSVLGLSPEMNSIKKVCDENNIILLEDNCESQGTTYSGIKLGNFGLMSSFSTYFGHTMSTIEGGMISTNDFEMYELLLQLRSHGWSRDLSDETKLKLREEHNISDFNDAYTFYQAGFNVRSTDLQAVIGLKQLQKVDGFIKKRIENFEYYQKRISSYVTIKPEPYCGTVTANFAYPIILRAKDMSVISKIREKFIETLNENKIENRPLISGSMSKQPMYVSRYGRDKSIKAANLIHEAGVYVPNHPEMTKDDLERVIKVINNFRWQDVKVH